MQYERRWLSVSAIGLSLFLSALDATIVALALPTIAQHFQISDSWEHGGISISFFWVQAAPGNGPRLHKHPYEEIFVIQEGHATSFYCGRTNTHV
jgi:MFS family permease